MKELSVTQQSVLEYFMLFRYFWGFNPTIKECADELRVPTPFVDKIIDCLHEKGLMYKMQDFRGWTVNWRKYKDA